ncbi:hypothetical protein [Pseudoalteromonas obscura]|uniref:Uncharacterized protein n=1 Tax=Pseudoalteromonas obscura TaxID=3048491 RepID=A0ABT7EH78_9GAMM|nr:hypothetical protein [Pseudoalteromonas sp. P94(2023)]MDK2594377.1 hypothetical protein [Pseudoalteromonas sp. P94(2023)]
MEVEQAKPIHASIMKIAFFLQGIGSITNEDVEEFKGYSLEHLVQANKALSDYKEKQEDDQGYRSYITTTDIALAETYIRVHNSDFVAADEFQEMCEAMDSHHENTRNGHGVLIDGSGCHSLVELTSCGTGVCETIVTVSTPRAMYNFVQSQI